MGKVKPFRLEKLVAGILWNPERISLGTIKQSLEEQFGRVDIESGEVFFDHSPYYFREMGKPLKRLFYGFRNLVNPQSLWKIKSETNRLERQFCDPLGNRPVNIDPGLLSLSKLILASTKNFSHRIPLNEGIYGELTLFYKHRKWQILPWTYPDYQVVETLEFLSEARSVLQNNLNQG